MSREFATRPFRSSIRTLVASLGAVLLTGSALSAQESPLPFLPAGADVVIRLREPDRAIEEVAELVDKVQGGMGALVRAQADSLGQLISNPALTGVDRSRPWYVTGYFFQGKTEPVAVFAIPAVNAADLVGALGGDVKSEVHDRWVIYTPAGEFPKAEGDRKLAADWSPQLAAALDGGDLTMYLNVRHLSGLYAGELDALHQQAREGLNALRYLMPQQDQPMNLQQIVEIYGGVADGLLQAVKDAQHLVLSINLDEGSVAVDKTVTFQPESEAAKRIAANPGSRFSLLGKLPANLDLYFGGTGFLEWAISLNMDLTTDLVTDPAQKEQLKSTMQQMREMKFGELAAGVKFQPGDAGLFNSYGLMQVTPAEKFRDLNRTSQQQLSVLEFNGIKQTTEVQLDAETVGTYQVDVARARTEITRNSPETELQQKMQRLMFGAELQSRSAWFGDINANTLNGGAESMRALLRSFEDSKPRTGPEYPQPVINQGNLLVQVDLVRVVAFTLMAASREEVLPLRISEQSIDGLNLQRSYIAVAVGSEGNTLKSQLRVPVQQIQGFTRLGALFAALSQSL